jgi:Cu(I)/Ag(I) efflux system protein CusF
MNKSLSLLAASLLLTTGSVFAGGEHGAHGAKPATTTASATEMVDGEVRKVDMDAKKITVKHGEIKSLEMPGMTMVFQVKDPAMLDMVKTGDKVMFKAEKANGAMVVTEIQAVK